MVLGVGCSCLPNRRPCVLVLCGMGLGRLHVIASVLKSELHVACTDSSGVLHECGLLAVFPTCP
eukprot:673596-Amphidinium_carterae.1